jgi:ribosomal protein S27AE
MRNLVPVLLLLSCPLLPGQIVLKIGPEPFTTPVEGTPVTFIGTGTVKLFTPPGQQKMEVEIDSQIDLSGLQSAVPGIVQKKGNRNDDCGDIVRLHTVELRASADVFVAAHYERWSCAIGKNKLFEQSGDMTITLALTVANGGRELAVNSTVKSFHADGVLGGLMQSSVVGPYLTDWLQAKIRDAVNPANLKASFPAGLSQYNPVFKSARFVDLASGKLGAAIAATFSLDQEQAQKLTGNLKH